MGLELLVGTSLKLSKNWWRRAESNRRLPACKAGALPTEPRPHTPICYAEGLRIPMVGTGGLEPPTSRLSGVRSNHLSYAPIDLSPSKLDSVGPS